MLGHHAGLGQIGRTLQADGKGMQAGPPGAALRVVLDAVLRKALGNGGDDRRVEAAAEQHAVGHVGHQLTAHGILQSVVQVGDGGAVVLHGIVAHPVALIVALKARLQAPIVVAGGKGS